MKQKALHFLLSSLLLLSIVVPCKSAITDSNPPLVILSGPAIETNGPFVVELSFAELYSNVSTEVLCIENGYISNTTTRDNCEYSITIIPFQTGIVSISLDESILNSGLLSRTSTAKNLQVNYKGYCNPELIEAGYMIEDFQFNHDKQYLGVEDQQHTSPWVSPGSQFGFTFTATNLHHVQKDVACVGIWLDLNDDFSFDEKGESLYTACFAFPYKFRETKPDSIYIPANVLPGEHTLRIILQEGSVPTACSDNFHTGDIMEISINIVDKAPVMVPANGFALTTPIELPDLSPAFISGNDLLCAYDKNPPTKEMVFPDLFPFITQLLRSYTSF